MISVAYGKGLCSSGQAAFVSDQELNALDKIGASYQHAKINGVEVLCAVETSCKIGFGFNCGMAAGAQGAVEPEDPMKRFRGDGQKGFDHMPDGNAVADVIQLLITESCIHQVESLGRRLRQFFMLTI